MKRALTLTAALLLGAACDEKKPEPAAAAVAPKPVAAAPVAEAPAAPTGPDGPSDIVVPKLEPSAAAADIAKGKDLFAAKGCVACHKIGGGKLVGPDLKDVLVRRTPTWVSKMVLKPELMVQKDDTAKALFRSLLIPMPNQGVDPQKELPFLLSYLKSESTGAAAGGGK